MKFGGLGWREGLRNLQQQFWKYRILDEATMLSFYFILSIFPLLLFFFPHELTGWRHSVKLSGS